MKVNYSTFKYQSKMRKILKYSNTIINKINEKCRL